MAEVVVVGEEDLDWGSRGSGCGDWSSTESLQDFGKALSLAGHFYTKSRVLSCSTSALSLSWCSTEDHDLEVLSRIYIIGIKLQKLSFPEGSPTMRLSLHGLLEATLPSFHKGVMWPQPCLPAVIFFHVDLSLSTSSNEHWWATCTFLWEQLPFKTGENAIGLDDIPIQWDQIAGTREFWACRILGRTDFLFQSTQRKRVWK